MLSKKPSVNPVHVAAFNFFPKKEKLAPKEIAEKLINYIVKKTLVRFRSDALLCSVTQDYEKLGLALSFLEGSERKLVLERLKNAPKNQVYLAYNGMIIALPFLDADERLSIYDNIVSILALQAKQGFSEIDACFCADVLVAYIKCFKQPSARQFALQEMLHDNLLNKYNYLLLQRVLPELMTIMDEPLARICLPLLKEGINTVSYLSKNAAKKMIKSLLKMGLINQEDVMIQSKKSLSTLLPSLQPVSLSSSASESSAKATLPKEQKATTNEINFEKLRVALTPENADDTVLKLLSIKDNSKIFCNLDAMRIFVDAFLYVNEERQQAILHRFLSQIFLWRQKNMFQDQFLEATKDLLYKISDDAKQLNFLCDLIAKIDPENNANVAKLKAGEITIISNDANVDMNKMIIELLAVFYDCQLSRYHARLSPFIREVLSTDNSPLPREVTEIAVAYSKRF